MRLGKLGRISLLPHALPQTTFYTHTSTLAVTYTVLLNHELIKTCIQLTAGLFHRTKQESGNSHRSKVDRSKDNNRKRLGQ